MGIAQDAIDNRRRRERLLVLLRDVAFSGEVNSDTREAAQRLLAEMDEADEVRRDGTANESMRNRQPPLEQAIDDAIEASISWSEFKRVNLSKGRPMMEGSEQQPSVGRSVHFVEARHDRVEHRAAVITQVNASDVHLTVWTPYDDYRLTYVRYDPTGAPGTWHFPERAS